MAELTFDGALPSLSRWLSDHFDVATLSAILHTDRNLPLKVPRNMNDVRTMNILPRTRATKETLRQIFEDENLKDTQPLTDFVRKLQSYGVRKTQVTTHLANHDTFYVNFFLLVEKNGRTNCYFFSSNRLNLSIYGFPHTVGPGGAVRAKFFSEKNPARTVKFSPE